MYGYIYKTTNLLNNKIYIGKKVGKFRSSYFGSGILIGQAINKYGKNNFKVRILKYAKDKHILNKLEKHYIKKYRNKFGKRNLYNIGDGGEGWDTVWNHPRYKEIAHLNIIRRNKIHWSNPINIKKHKQVMKLSYQKNPKLRKNRKNQIKKLWTTKKYRNSQRKGRKRRKANGWFKNPKEMSRRLSKSLKGMKAWNKINFNVNRAIRLYRKDVSVREISEIIGVSEHVIRNRFRPLNIIKKK